VEKRAEEQGLALVWLKKKADSVGRDVCADRFTKKVAADYYSNPTSRPASHRKGLPACCRLPPVRSIPGSKKIDSTSVSFLTNERAPLGSYARNVDWTSTSQLICSLCRPLFLLSPYAKQNKPFVPLATCLLIFSQLIEVRKLSASVSRQANVEGWISGQ
jgi:hypothetical protein